MLSRVASSVFWMARYVERAENTARFLEVNQFLSLDNVQTADQWGALVDAAGHRQLYDEIYGTPTSENVLRFLMFDGANPNSIRSCVEKARENARTVRESISNPMWEEVQTLRTLLQDHDGDPAVMARPVDFLTEVRRSSHALFGVTNTTLLHDEGFHFAKMGRTLERADMTSRILDVKYYLLLPNGKDDVGTPIDTIHWAALLKSASALQMYRQRYGRIHPRNVADFLLLDRDFPRSVRFCLSEAERSLHAVTGTPFGEFRNRPEQLLGQLRSGLEFSHVEDIFRNGLHEQIAGLQKRIAEVGSAIRTQFFDTRPNTTAKQSQRQSSGRQTQSQTFA